MAREASRERERLWQERVERQAVSGVSIQAFCEQERISQAAFYAWRRRLREQATPPARRVATRRTVAGRDGAEPRRVENFIPLKLLDATTAWEVVHPHGYHVRVSGEVTATTLECMVGVLDRRLQG